ncbi:hypothetical protein ACHAWU_000119 [Discostella pseudostelligera]|uniref:Uncharacterized protein n=1 Tax=Discostella pseudostelligera TaxID=259834 RepID=A0ABD3MHK5_9STRA
MPAIARFRPKSFAYCHCATARTQAQESAERTMFYYLPNLPWCSNAVNCTILLRRRILSRH